MKLTLDANLFVARFSEADAAHKESVAFFEACEQQRIRFFAPIILLGEVSGAISRLRGEARFGDLAIARILSLPRLRFRQIDSDFAEAAAHLAARHQLRGVDALYLLLAGEMKTALVSWDKELLKQTGGANQVITPADWLASKGS